MFSFFFYFVYKLCIIRIGKAAKLNIDCMKEDSV